MTPLAFLLEFEIPVMIKSSMAKQEHNFVKQSREWAFEKPPRFGFDTGFASGRGEMQIPQYMSTEWGSSKSTVRNIVAGWNSLHTLL